MESSSVQQISKPKPFTASRGGVRNELSNGLVRLYRQIFGRGPVRTATYEFDAGYVTFLRDVLVPQERVLIQNGRQDLVCEMRLAAREAERKRLISEVERVTGRAVLCDFFQMQPERDLAVELFWLGAPSRDDARIVAAHQPAPPNGARYTEMNGQRPDWPA